LGPEGGRPGRPTQAIGHAFSENLGIVQIFKEYFKFLNRFFKAKVARHVRIVIKTKKSLNFVVKIKLQGIFEIFL
jgi:hypothetical protein